MPFEEKLSWVNLIVTIVVAGVYAAIVMARATVVPLTQVAYQVPMLIAIGATVVLTIAGAIAVGIGTGVFREFSRAMTGEGLIEDIGRNDERDADITRRGMVAGSYVFALGALGALVLTMLKLDHFWIGNALYLCFIASSVVTGIYKLVIYRRGF
jgi:hypothetical protein